MNRIQKFFNSQVNRIPNDYTYDFALRRLCVAKEDSWRGILPSNYSSDYNPEPPIFSAKFANCDGYRHMLAIANEDGKIALQDTTLRNYESEERALNAPQCHFNAVFDLEWAPGQMKFVSASGDHTARLWEVSCSEIRSVRAFSGHTRSVKTAAFRKSDSSVFATGGRDGAIIIWDTRANLNLDLTPRADNCIYSGHVGGPGTPVSQKKRSRTPKLTPNATSSSITGLVFQDTNTLISCGAGDGIIKVWDLRRNYTAYKKEPHPKYSLPYAGTSTFKGFTNLLIDDAGAKLFANCMDNTIYCYNLFSYSPKPLAKYKGLLNSTFYIKSCLSPDGKYLLSGSSDEKAYIWNLKYPQEPLVSLSGHTVEVTCVAWGATHDQPIVTCSDDARHKIWRIGPELITESDKCELYRGHADFVRSFDRKAVNNGSTHKYNLRELESTPRSLKRLVEQNERTPGSIEKISTKRSFLEMLGAAPGADCVDEHEVKRPKTLESRGRRLFSPSTSNSTTASCSSSSPPIRCLNIQLSTIPEERLPANTITTSPLSRNQTSNDSNQENATLPSAELSPLPSVSTKFVNGTMLSNHNCITTPSPLSERAIESLNQIYTSPPNTNSTYSPASSSVMAASTSNSASNSSTTSLNLSAQQQSVNSVIYSPTTNLPNFVIDGDAPHLAIMSPKRKLRDKVDWLTKIRKQKLMSTCRGSTITDKINEERMDDIASPLNNGHCTVGGIAVTATAAAASPRLQSLRGSEGPSSPRASHSTVPRRRTSRSGSHSNELLSSPSSSHHHHQQHNHPKTPTSSRRNSETTILRFFSVQQQQQQQQRSELAVEMAQTLTETSAAIAPAATTTTMH